MSTLLTMDELEREVLYLREQNQKILRELSRVVEENSGLLEELHCRREMQEHASGRWEKPCQPKNKKERPVLKPGITGMSTILN